MQIIQNANWMQMCVAMLTEPIFYMNLDNQKLINSNIVIKSITPHINLFNMFWAKAVLTDWFK